MIRASRRLPGLPGLISELPGGEPGRPSPPPGRAFPPPGRLLPGPSRRLPGPGSAFLAGERPCPWNPSDFCSSSAAHPPRAPDELKKSLGFRGQRVEEPDKWFQRGESGKALRVACGSLAGPCGSLPGAGKDLPARTGERRREETGKADREAHLVNGKAGRRPGSPDPSAEPGRVIGGSFRPLRRARRAPPQFFARLRDDGGRR